MAARPPEPLDDRVEALLRSSRPSPPAQLALVLRERLLPERRARWRGRRTVVAGGLATATAALAVLILSLAGAGPLAGRSGQDVKARTNCHFVLVKARGRVPVVVHSRDGQARIVYRDEPVERPVERCG
jgi:hypothetical protein